MRTINSKGPQFCEVILDLKQEFSPKLGSIIKENGSMISSSLENMSPFLKVKELEENMLLKSEE